jgi:O-antigen ligase
VSIAAPEACRLVRQAAFFIVDTDAEQTLTTTSMPGVATQRGLRLRNAIPFAALLCAALFANFVLVPGHDWQRILEIGVLMLGGAGLLACRARSLGQLFSGVDGKLLAAFFLLGVCGSATAYAPRMAIFEVAVFFMLYAVAVAVAREIARHGVRALRLIAQVIAGAGALYTVKFFVAYCAAYSLDIPLAVDDFTPGFSNIRHFNHAQTSTLPLLVLLCCLTPRTSRLRWLWLGVTAYWWLALYATSARGSLLGLGVACMAVALVAKRAAWPYLKTLAFTAVLGVLAYVVLLDLVPILSGKHAMNALAYSIERTAADPASGRMQLWRRAVELIMQHPLLGVGPMHFAHNSHDLHIGAHPHDWVMQIASEWGLPALACLLAAVGLGLRALARAGRRVDTKDATGQAVFAALALAVGAILVDGLVSGLFVMPQSQLAIALVLGCAMGWCRSATRTAPQGTASAMGVDRRLAGAVVVLAALAGLATAIPDVRSRLNGEPLSAAQLAVNTGWGWPRMWKEGYF